MPERSSSSLYPVLWVQQLDYAKMVQKAIGGLDCTASPRLDRLGALEIKAMEELANVRLVMKISLVRKVL